MTLVIPATFAEPIALSIKSSGIDAYFNVQLFVGFMYIAAFMSRKCPFTVERCIRFADDR